MLKKKTSKKTLKDKIWNFKNIVNKARMGKKAILIVEG